MDLFVVLASAGGDGLIIALILSFVGLLGFLLMAYNERCPHCGKWLANKVVPPSHEEEGEPKVIGEEEIDRRTGSIIRTERASNPFYGESTYQSRVDAVVPVRQQIVSIPILLVQMYQCRANPNHVRHVKKYLKSKIVKRRMD
jgi:hypothetical protein